MGRGLSSQPRRQGAGVPDTPGAPAARPKLARQLVDNGLAVGVVPQQVG